jgi:Mor family transcriptional regulator
MVSELGGTRWSVTGKPKIAKDHPWCKVLGIKSAQKLHAYAMGSKAFRIPMNKEAIDEMIYGKWKAGTKMNDLALHFKRDHRAIQKALERHRKREDAKRRTEGPRRGGTNRDLPG